MHRLIELWFSVPLDSKPVISKRCSSSQFLDLVWKKLNITQQKQAFTNQKNVLQHKKLEPG